MNEQLTVLIIDPNAEERARYCAYLTNYPLQPYTVYEAESGSEGLRLFDSYSPNVVILEFQLPDMTGLELIPKLQAAANVPVPVVMLTGQENEEIAIQALKHGAHDCLPKQVVDGDRLEQALRRTVQQCHLEQRLHESQERQRLIATTAFQIRQSLDLPQILTTAVSDVREVLRCDRVVVYQFNSDKSGTIVAESVASGWTSALGRTIIDPCFQNEIRQEYLQGRQRAISDIYTEEGLTDCHIQLLEQFDIRANLIVPLLFQETANAPDIHTLWGLLIAQQCAKPRQWREEEMDILNALAVQLSIGIQHTELLKQTQSSLSKERELNAFKSRIITTVSHEYRTPLTMIFGGAELLERYHDRFDDEKRLKYLRQIQHAAAHMTDLVNDLLFASQVELNQIQFQPTHLDLVTFVGDLVEEHQHLAHETHTLRFTHQGKNREFCGDSSLLRQMISNLLSNAVKYSPEGGLVDVKLKLGRHQVTLQVRDHGIGIPDADLDRLFQAFGRASNVGTIPGTGLGLVIVQSCVQLHNGTIAIASKVNQGTLLTITLPR